MSNARPSQTFPHAQPRPSLAEDFTPPPFTLVSCGYSLPTCRLDNNVLARELQLTEDWIIARSGIQHRFCASPQETTASLGAAAARQALDLAPNFVPDLLLCATFTPERLLCPTAPEVASRLGLTNVGAFDINAACAGASVALLTAVSYLGVGLAHRVLLVCSDTTTKFLAPSDRNTRILMSDGAAAVAMCADEASSSRLLAWTMGSAGAQAGAFLVPNGGSARPHQEGNCARGSTVTMDGPALFRFGVERGPRILADLCGQAGIETSDLDWVLMHQANVRMIRAMQERVDVLPERWLINVDRLGNTVSASIFILLAQQMQLRLFQKNDRVAIVGFGAGLTWAGLLLEW